VSVVNPRSDYDVGVWLHRRLGFGLDPVAQQQVTDRGPAAELDTMIAAAASPQPDAWDDADLPYDPQNREARLAAVTGWFAQLRNTAQPLLDRVAWIWHGHFVSSLDKVRSGRAMVDQIRLFRRAGLGAFPDLVRAVTIDPAMLRYLDLATSTGEQPNENYARELMELFTLGVGQFGEDDVQSVARALSGWRVDRDGTVRFVPRRHDGTPQAVLGVDGVNDLDSVVAALAAHPALPQFVARAVAAEVLGDVEPGVIDELAETFAATLDVASLVRAVGDAGLAGSTSPMVSAPLPWLATALRVTGAQPDPRVVLRGLRATGQVPMLPPNVGGWPRGAAWFATDSIVARSNLAVVIAESVPSDSALIAACEAADADRIAELLTLYEGGVGAATAAAIGARSASPVQRLAVALVSPEFVVV
jgi:uncharacterized protein (DUF1800 family)